jgi:DNA-binding GntR family transcriptional regulator
VEQAHPSGSAAERIVADLQRRIFDGDLTPGSSLREAELAERYRASRHTVRAALRALIGVGLVVHDPHRSARVRELGGQDIRDLFLVRRVVELEAVRRLIADDLPLVAIDQAVAHREAVEAEAVAGGRGYTVEEVDADLAFHRALVHSVGSERLSRTFETLANELRLAFLAYIDDSGDRGDHRAIFEAISARDGDRASELLDLHLRDGLRYCLAAHADGRERLVHPGA